MGIGLILGCALVAAGISVKFWGHAAYHQESKAYAVIAGGLAICAGIVWFVG